jgi:hypothetical protein
MHLEVDILRTKHGCLRVPLADLVPTDLKLALEVETPLLRLLVRERGRLPVARGVVFELCVRLLVEP